MFYLYCIVSAESRAGDMEIVPNRGGGRLTRTFFKLEHVDTLTVNVMSR